VAVDFSGDRHDRADLMLHGAYARRLPKKSYRLEFPDDDQLLTSLFGEAERHRRIVLQASWIDPTFLRNKLTMDLVREQGGLAPRTAFVTLSFNRRYDGLFVAIERVDRQFLRRQGLSPDGNLYKAVTHAADWSEKADPLSGFERAANEENPTDDLAHLLAVCSETPPDAFPDAVEPALSLDDFMAWQLVNTFAMNRDCYTKNYYLYHDLSAAPGTPEARFRVIPWDADATWAVDWDGTPLDPAAEAAWHGSDTLSPRLFQIPRYRDEYLARYQGAIAGVLSPRTLVPRIDALASMIREEARRDLAAWQPEVDLEAELSRLRSAVAARHAVMEAAVEAAK